MPKKILFLLCLTFFMSACFKEVKKETDFYSAKVQNFAQVSSVFKVEVDEKLGEGSSLLLSVDYNKETGFYTIKVLGAFASVLLKAHYDLDSFTYDFKPQFLENEQVKEIFEQTLKVLITEQYNSKYDCTKKQCTLTLGGQMFTNKYIFSSYNKEGFAQDILCSYRRGIVKINLKLLRVNA